MIWIVLLIIVGVAIWYFFLRDTDDDAEALAAFLAIAAPFASHGRSLGDLRRPSDKLSVHGERPS